MGNSACFWSVLTALQVDLLVSKCISLFPGWRACLERILEVKGICINPSVAKRERK